MDFYITKILLLNFVLKKHFFLFVEGNFVLKDVFFFVLEAVFHFLQRLKLSGIWFSKKSDELNCEFGTALLGGQITSLLSYFCVNSPNFGKCFSSFMFIKTLISFHFSKTS